MGSVGVFTATVRISTLEEQDGKLKARGCKNKDPHGLKEGDTKRNLCTALNISSNSQCCRYTQGRPKTYSKVCEIP